MIECVPNVSEGQRPEVVAAIADAVRRVPGVRLLDVSSDTSHNRSVYTFVGDGAAVEQAALALIEHGIAAIDLRTHRGEHPRVGAVDVVPFVPLGDATMAECVALARALGAIVADRFGVPVYLYEEAATRPSRRRLEHIRRGGFEGLAAKMAQAEGAPDFGPARPHPSAGAIVIGARRVLIAFNVNLDTDRIDVAQAIARTIRFSSGGLAAVKAIGVRLLNRGLVQVSTNVTNYEDTSLRQVFEAVEREARRYGVGVLESEIVGLVPAAALATTDARALRLTASSAERVLENRLRDVG